MGGVPHEPRGSSDEIDLGDLLRRLRPRVPLLVIWGLIGAGLGVGYTLFIPPVWQARSSLLMAKSASMSPGLAIPGVLGGEADPLVRLRGVLESKRSRDRIKKEGNVTEEDLDRRLSIATDKQRDQIVIGFRDRDRERAKRVVASAVDSLRELDGTIGLSVGRQKQQVIDREIVTRASELRSRESELARYQRDNKVSLESKDGTGATMSLYARLAEAEVSLKSIDRQVETLRRQLLRRARLADSVPTGLPVDEEVRKALLEAELKLQETLGVLGPKHPEVARARSRVAEAQAQLRKSAESALKGVESDLDPTLTELLARQEGGRAEVEALRRLTDSLPEQQKRVAALSREIDALTEMLKALQVQRMQTKLTSELDTIAWSLLDEPYVEPVPVNKTPVRNAVLGFVLALLAGIVAFGVRWGR